MAIFCKRRVHPSQLQQMQPMDNRDEFPKKVEWDGDDCKLRKIKRVGIKRLSNVQK